jgi:hypothetical protein
VREAGARQEGALAAMEAAVRACGFGWSVVPLHRAYETESETDAVAALRAALDALRTVSAREDLVRQLRVHVLAEAARRGGHAKLLLGDTATRLAVQTLTETARGRAALLPLSIAFQQPCRTPGADPRSTQRGECMCFDGARWES